MFSPRMTSLLSSPMGNVLQQEKPQDTLKLPGNTPLKTAVETLNKRHLRTCVVTNPNKGASTEGLQLFDMRDLNSLLVDLGEGQNGETSLKLPALLAKLDSKTCGEVANYSKRNTYTHVTTDSPLSDAIKAFEQCPRVPIMKDGECVRIFSAVDFLHLVQNNGLIEEVASKEDVPIRSVKKNVKPVEFLVESESVFKAMWRLHATGYSALPLVDADDHSKPLGVLSVRDVRWLLLLAHELPTNVLQMNVGDFLTTVRSQEDKTRFPYIHVHEDSGMQAAIVKILATNVHRVLLIGHDKKLSGVVSITDVSKMLAQSFGQK